MTASSIFAKLEALAAKTPGLDDIDDMLKFVIDVLRAQFDAYLIDIVWEDRQGQSTVLKAVKMFESEKNQFRGRPLYNERKTPGKPDSLMGWCYEHNTPVWIVDPKGLRSKNQYKNWWVERYEHADDSDIPANTIFKYNKKMMRTEICYPLRMYIDPRWQSRAAGVLNIEILTEAYPTGTNMDAIRKAATVIEQLQCRRLAFQTADIFSKGALNELRAVREAIQRDREPSLIDLAAFIARPMSQDGAGDLERWIEDELRKLQIKCFKGSGPDRIIDHIHGQMRAAHFGIVVSMDYNPNVMYEWGYMAAAGKPIIRLHSKMPPHQTQPFNIAGVKWHAITEAPGEVPTKELVGLRLREAVADLFGRGGPLEGMMRQIPDAPGRSPASSKKRKLLKRKREKIRARHAR
jgi:hypothetical protein